MEFWGYVFKVLFKDLEVRCVCKLFLYNLFIVKTSTPGRVRVDKGSSLFVHIVCSQLIDTVRCYFSTFYVCFCILKNFAY